MSTRTHAMTLSSATHRVTYGVIGGLAGTVVGAALTHMVQLAADGGFSAIPWNLIIWAVPGAMLGAVLGTGVQGKVSPRVTRWFFSGLFLTIGVTFLLAFTVSKSNFG